MKKISFILLGVFGLLFSTNVYADDTDYFRMSEQFQFFNTNPIKNNYHQYSNFNTAYHYFSTSTPYGGIYRFYVDTLANISNRFHVEVSFSANISGNYGLVPTQDSNYLNSCMYLAQNSHDPRIYLQRCFNYSMQSDMTIENLQFSAISNEGLTFNIDDTGEASFQVNDEGLMFTFTFKFDALVTQTNHTYYITPQVFTTDGYFYFDDSTIMTSVFGDPKITIIPYFTAENSMFSSFFNSLDFNMHGLTGVVSTPIAFLRSLQNPPINQKWGFTVFGHLIELDNGNKLFWSRDDVYSFRLTWNILFGGFLIYIVYIRLFRFVKSLFNPNNDEVVTL